MMMMTHLFCFATSWLIALIKYVIQIKLVFGQTMNQISSTALRLQQQQHNNTNE